MITDLRKGILSELRAHQPIDIYRRNLQKSFIEKLINIVNPPADNIFTAATTTRTFGAAPATFSKTNDAISIAKMQLRSIASEIRSALPAYKDANSRAHLQDELDRITEALDPKK